METKLTSAQRAIACDLIAEHLKACASQEALEQAYYDAKVDHLQGLDDAYLLDVLRVCDFTLGDLQ